MNILYVLLGLFGFMLIPLIIIAPIAIIGALIKPYYYRFCIRVLGKDVTRLIREAKK